MALFSRRPKAAPDQTPADQPVTDEALPADEVPTAAPSVTETLRVGAYGQSGSVPQVADEPSQFDEQPEDAASVDISMSSFRGLGSHTPEPPATVAPEAAPAVAAESPPATETVPGLRDNVLVRDALAVLSDPPTSQQLLNVARQLLQGHLFLRVKGDARALLAEGKELPLAVASVGGKSFVMTYSGGAALQASIRADGDMETSAMGQPVLVVIRHLLSGPYEGMVIDQASAPARAVLPRELLERLIDNIDESLTIKSLLAEPRTPATAAAVAEALTRVPLWVAVGGAEEGHPGVAEARSDDGSRLLELYSHPIEVAAMGRSDQAAPLSAVQIASALSSDEAMTGVVVNPGGPWIRLTRDDLAPLIALAG